jgi:hypothetical protein
VEPQVAGDSFGAIQEFDQMDLILEAIKFNHDPLSATTDAFNIRRNEMQPVIVPEWRRGISLNPEDSPAAYARDEIAKNTITIRARFTCTDNTVTKVWVRALDGHQDHSSGSDTLKNVLGIVLMTEVPLSNGQSGFVELTLDNVRIGSAGVSVSDVIWKWKFSLNSQDWNDLVTTTHRIYTVLCLPTEPWQPGSLQPTNIQIPWTDVLDYACAWAAGAQDVDAAASKITEDVNALGLGKVTYDPTALYIQQGTDNFLCTEFLDRVGGGPGRGDTVNCSDCATAVSIFSNILGASLAQSSMGSHFYFNHVRKIGQREEDGGNFQRHEVAWKGGCTKDDYLFDACLQLDFDEDPENNPFLPLLPTNILFGTPENGQYQFHLAGRKTYGGPCEADPSSKRHRLIGAKRLRRRLASEKELAALKNFYHFTSWENVRLSDEHLFVWRSFAAGTEVPGWRTTCVQGFDIADGMPPTNESLWAPHKEANVLLRVNTYECPSSQSAALFLLTVLGESDAAYMKREDSQNRTSFGDVSFTNLDATSILFSRGNMVVSARSADRARTSPAEFLHVLDVSLKSQPAHKKIEQMDRFRFEEGWFQDADHVPLKFIGEESQQTQYKFFSKSGEVFLKGEQLFYQPLVASLQKVQVFGIDADGSVKKQQLSILIGK